MKFFSNLIFCTTLIIAPQVVFSAENTELSGMTKLKAALAKHLPGATITRVSKTPIDGLYEVIVGSNIVYMNETAEYMVDGDLVNLFTKQNYTEEARSVIRMSSIEQLGEDNMLVYKPEKVNHTVTVVTDINCPYCRRLHAEMDEYLENGVKVQYIFMPLKGPKDHETTVSVWCADDRNKALDIAKSGGTVEKKTCDNPIDDHMKVSREMGIRGTPAIILDDGTMIPGYVPVKKLVGELNKP